MRTGAGVKLTESAQRRVLSDKRQHLLDNSDRSIYGIRPNEASHDRRRSKTVSSNLRREQKHSFSRTATISNPNIGATGRSEGVQMPKLSGRATMFERTSPSEQTSHTGSKRLARVECFASRKDRGPRMRRTKSYYFPNEPQTIISSEYTKNYSEKNFAL